MSLIEELTDDVRAELLAGPISKERAGQLNMIFPTARRLRQKLLDDQAQRYIDIATKASEAPETAPAVCPPPLRVVEPVVPLKLARWLYAADLHAPLHDDRWIERLCRVAYHLEVESLVIGGDAFDNGETSAHGQDMEAADINEGLKISGQVLRYIKSHFKTVYILPGNHCRRLAKRLDRNLHFENLMRMAVGDLTGFVTTNNDYFLINDTWTVGHPRFFASFPAKGLETVAVQRQRNVIGAHSHTWGIIRHGKFLCVSPGHLMRPDLTPYLVRGDGLSKHPSQDSAQGFVLVEEELVTMFGEDVTRWSDYR